MLSNTKLYNLKKRTKIITEYSANPNYCNECWCCLPHPTQTRLKKFCSMSCSARFNNHVSPKRKKIEKKSKPIKKRICSECGKIEYLKHFVLTTCFNCQDSINFRRKCEFKFSLKEYPNEFNLSLLASHGMFHPVTNYRGVSRDHLISVQYAKEHNIDPKLISHPANCELILHSENKRRQGKCSITIQELMVRIEKWDNKYPI